MYAYILRYDGSTYTRVDSSKSGDDRRGSRYDEDSINLSFTAETPPPGTIQTYHGEIHSFGRVHQFHVGRYQVTLAQQGAPSACWMAGLVHVRRK